MTIWTWVGAVLLLVGTAAIPVGVLLQRGRPKNPVGEISTDLGIALTTGALVALAVLLAAEDLDRAREIRDVRRDNLRFVREVAVQAGPTRKPFRFFDLQGQLLAGFDLSNADLASANLVGADLSGTNLSGAFMADADLTGANLTVADFRNANLSEVRFGRADLVGTNLRGADLFDADLEGVNLADACWDSTTTWPKGFQPQLQPNCGLWDAILTDDPTSAGPPPTATPIAGESSGPP